MVWKEFWRLFAQIALLCFVCFSLLLGWVYAGMRLGIIK